MKGQLIGPELREQWETQGYVVVCKVFDTERTERLHHICERILEQWRTRNPETGESVAHSDPTVMRHLNHPDYFVGYQQEYSKLMEAIADHTVLTVCRTVFGEDPLFRCTSLFMNPRGKSQAGNWHRDSQFRHPDEHKEQALLRSLDHSGAGIQMQIPLVPSDDLEYVPGSHLRWDTPEEYQIRRSEEGKHSQSDAMPSAMRMALEPGDAVLFNPYGLHRGRYHIDKLRRTLMLTYTKASKPHYDYFSHQPWFLEPDYMAQLKPEPRAFFDLFVETYKADWLANHR